MKSIWLIGICGIGFCYISLTGVTGNPGSSPSKRSPVDTVSFHLQIKPLLQKNCSPCHFPGGKMYEKLPFDSAQIIILHPDGILKRFKGEENLLIRKFLDLSDIH